MGEAKRRGSREQRIEGLLRTYGIKKMTKERYNAFVAWTRAPAADMYGQEIEFYSNEPETLIGVVLLDRIDHDYAFVTLGRDLKSRFRCIDVSASMSRTDARHALFHSIAKHSSSGDAVFPQHDEAKDKAGLSLFSPVVAESKIHKSFQLLRDGEHWLPARSIINEMMNHFIDVDGNFAEQFQTTGFDSRIWELYLFAALLELGLIVNKDHEAPDFQVEQYGKKVFIEAVTAGPSPNDPPPPTGPEGRPSLRSAEEIKELLKTRAPIRFGSALYSKLNRRPPKTPYWELEHVKGYPLIFAVADFHEDQSMTWTSPALLEYLYGVTHEFLHDEKGQLVITPLELKTHEYNGKKIPSGFFFQKDAGNVSAVLFSSSGTLSKFNRMGHLAGFGPSNQKIYRTGVKHRHDANAALPTPFFYEVKQGVITESWAEGLSMFHNPNAVHEVDRRMFPGIAHHYFVDRQIVSYLPDFHPYSSFTWNFLISDLPAGEEQNAGAMFSSDATQN